MTAKRPKHKKAGWVHHTRNCAYERRGLNKRIRAEAKIELRKES